MIIVSDILNHHIWLNCLTKLNDEVEERGISLKEYHFIRGTIRQSSADIVSQGLLTLLQMEFGG